MIARNLTIMMVLAGVAFGSCRVARADEPIQPAFQTHLSAKPGWKWQIVLHRAADGKLVLIGDCGPEGAALASADEGRTWHDWQGMHTWPNINASAITRRGNDLFIHHGQGVRVELQACRL